ncbi:6870_t:CDS:2, partial [Paraglomus occultum]
TKIDNRNASQAVMLEAEDSLLKVMERLNIEVLDDRFGNLLMQTFGCLSMSRLAMDPPLSIHLSSLIRSFRFRASFKSCPGIEETTDPRELLSISIFR